jgi:hypothetical protein
MPATLTYPWIINKRSDLLWLIGPVIFSIAALALFYFFTAGINTDISKTVFIFYIAWALIFDSSHFFATYTRTYFDKPFFRQNRPVLLITWCTFLIGPLFIGLPFLFSKDINLLRNTFTIFNRFCICMAYFHLVRQHWGIIAIYRRRNNETDNTTRRMEHALLLLGCFLPFLYFQYSNMPLLGSSEIFSAFELRNWHREIYYLMAWAMLLLLLHFFTRKKWPFLKLQWVAAGMGIIAIFISLANLTGLKSLLGWICSMMFTAFIVLLQRYVLYKPGKNINVPKWGLLLTVITAHAIFIMLPIPYLLKAVLVGIYHNIQYHRIVYYHNQNKYTGTDSASYGMAAVFTKRIGVLIIFIALFSLAATGFQWGSRALLRGEVANYFIACIAWAIPLHHYILDAVIWRLRKDESLLKHLNAA